MVHSHRRLLLSGCGKLGDSMEPETRECSPPHTVRCVMWGCEVVRIVIV